MEVVSRIRPSLAVLVVTASGALSAGQERVVESIVPALAYGHFCSSTVELQNLSDRATQVEVEGHKASGALAALAGHPDNAVVLGPRERSSYKLQIEQETVGAWVKVRERVPSPRQSPVVAVSAAVECVAGNELRTQAREVAYTTRNPWFSSDVADLHGGVILLINASEHAVKAAACYSSGTLFSKGDAELKPVCSTAFDVQVPPFGSREFPVERDGSSYFSLKTQGNAIVLEMLRPVEATVRMYAVDSTIQFGSEVPAKR